MNEKGVIFALFSFFIFDICVGFCFANYIDFLRKMFDYDFIILYNILD